ncbi:MULTISPECIES: urease accessory protein UreE [unclassified Colwellia]|jgi:urease accessory protein|uniref:urease accessory protein UreE n=1 Tax=unclassified Colwellia TaxID=196834 RepID=UPI0015F755F6|nr:MULTISPECIES: urease accessory protein UreE [unclassified Colwellia]MBA6363369.1 urease accessory protein UreE [Colwellia sp. BRX8-8]MBA6350364.1 urease accessory protein UreE [Colwellia sp. BRX8-9]MBA6350979.1 urease accessory protein UreE [Colwellia sp. BRX9-1]MBA6373164.1 urease accessory protein UreE [Colwellia sp. BRX8-4]MBA6381118.1 urease accessory protein UreE [Colwellia sp. BRX10-7]
MLQAHQRFDHTHHNIADSITLDQDTRKKARIKGKTDGGLDIGIFMARGQPLLVGEVLKTDCGLFIEIKGQAEPVSTAIATDWLTFCKVCYHLGNRHTSLQIGELWVRFKPDHVLEELAQKYGLTIDNTPTIFEPENGAYGVSSHGHAHAH